MSRWIIGGGMTGLAAGMASGFRLLERHERPGGICASYERQGYRFELGGGHWIFGGDPIVNRLLASASEIRNYRRRSAVLFLGAHKNTSSLRNLFVPYPIQDNLFALPREIRSAALAEIMRGNSDTPAGTMQEWLRQQFGEVLCHIFFDPFHERYTAGLFGRIAPQDGYKSPIDKAQVLRGSEQENTDAGYNAVFKYPARGLDVTSQWLAKHCQIEYAAEVTRIDPKRRCLVLGSGREIPYDIAVATTPLNRLIDMTEGLGERIGPADPHTSVLVLNLGVTVPDTPLARNGYHWLYVPDSKSGFHRIGYYSNVDSLFLPEGHRNDPSRASIYIETAFRQDQRLSKEGIDRFVDEIIVELRSSGLIDTVEAVDPTWVDVAYTWRSPRSDWVSRATAACQEAGIEPAGRFGRWTFQGIAASLKEGLLVGSVLRYA